jgi:Zn-dependent M28 family amino/carboxypeptidase
MMVRASRLMPLKWRPLRLAALAFGLSPLASSSLASQGLPRPDSVQLIRDLFVLAADSMEGRRIGTPGGQKAQTYLGARLKSIGVSPIGASLAAPFASAGRGGDSTRGVNLVGVIRGTRAPERYIVLSAHYDHVGIREGTVFPGADDNASGTSAVLAIAAWLKRNPPANSVIIALFDGEEGGLRGARAFVATPPVPLDKIIANVNLDMVSRSDKNELYVAGGAPNPKLKPLVDATIAVAPLTLKAGHDVGSGGDNWTNQSDQGAFAAKGVPWIYFGVEDHADYHKATDFPDRVPQGFFYRSVQTVAEFVRRLDAAPPSP